MDSSFNYLIQWMKKDRLFLLSLYVIVILIFTTFAIYFNAMFTTTLLVPLLMVSLVIIIANIVTHKRSSDERYEKIIELITTQEKENINTRQDVIEQIDKLRSSLSFQEKNNEDLRSTHVSYQLLYNILKKEKLENFSDKYTIKQDFDHEIVLSTYREVASEFSHAIKSPISSIDYDINNLNSLMREFANENSIKDKRMKLIFNYIENIKLSNENAKEIIRTGAGFIQTDPMIFSFGTMVEKIIRLAKLPSDNKPDININVGDVKEIKFYWINLYIVLNQILENSIDSLRNKKDGRIEISAEYNDLDGKISIFISNNGDPIPEEDRKLIFNPGFSTKKNHGNTGFGLTLAKKVIESVNGGVELFESNIEKTTFKISFTPLEVINSEK